MLPRPAPAGASRLAVLRGRALAWLGRSANRVGVPGAIRACDVVDEASGQRFTVTVGPLFTRVCVNGREYFFRRWSGEFDGTATCAV